MIPETVSETTDPCQLARRWIIATELAERIVCLTHHVPFSFQIISGWRDRDEQESLIRAGRGAAMDKSTHTSCPATGADLWPLVAVTTNVKGYLGAACTLCGLRWGGGSSLDEDGLPWDWNHVDLGPRGQ
jgi:hypothetical protein